jgi:hypothetical protein
MGFRRDGKKAHEEARSWERWKAAHAALVQASGLPVNVFRTRADWDYLLRYGYHCDSAYPHIDYRLEEQTETQRAAFRLLLERVLTTEEKTRGSAGWHHVCPPASPGKE